MPKRIFRRACYQPPDISKATLKASFDEGTPTRILRTVNLFVLGPVYFSTKIPQKKKSLEIQMME